MSKLKKNFKSHLIAYFVMSSICLPIFSDAANLTQIESKDVGSFKFIQSTDSNWVVSTKGSDLNIFNRTSSHSRLNLVKELNLASFLPEKYRTQTSIQLGQVDHLQISENNQILFATLRAVNMEDKDTFINLIPIKTNISFLFVHNIKENSTIVLQSNQFVGSTAISQSGKTIAYVPESKLIDIASLIAPNSLKVINLEKLRNDILKQNKNNLTDKLIYLKEKEISSEYFRYANNKWVISEYMFAKMFNNKICPKGECFVISTTENKVIAFYPDFEEQILLYQANENEKNLIVSQLERKPLIEIERTTIENIKKIDVLDLEKSKSLFSLQLEPNQGVSSVFFSSDEKMMCLGVTRRLPNEIENHLACYDKSGKRLINPDNFLDPNINGKRELSPNNDLVVAYSKLSQEYGLYSLTEHLGVPDNLNNKLSSPQLFSNLGKKVINPTYSMDSKYLIYQDNNFRVNFVDISTGNSISVKIDKENYLNDVIFLENNLVLIVASDAYLVDISNLEPKIVNVVKGISKVRFNTHSIYDQLNKTIYLFGESKFESYQLE